jgi:hypothetical protein
MAEASLTSGQFAALRELAKSGHHLGELVQLNYIEAESDGYAPTASGSFRAAAGL